MGLYKFLFSLSPSLRLSSWSGILDMRSLYLVRINPSVSLLRAARVILERSFMRLSQTVVIVDYHGSVFRRLQHCVEA